MPAGDRQTENGIFQRMAVQGQTVIAASGDAGSEDCFPTRRASTDRSRSTTPARSPTWSAPVAPTLTSASASSQSVWNDCQDKPPRAAGQRQPRRRRRGVLARVARQPGPARRVGRDTDPCGLGTCRAVPDLSYPSDPTAGGVAAYWDGRWTGFGGTSVAAPTNAGLFADTNQGCFSQLGRVGPALYAAQQANGDTFTDITSGNNDFTDTNGGLFAAAAGFDAASGLGTPVDQNLAIALQGADGCPSVAAVSPNTGPVSGGGRHHDLRGRLRQRHLGDVRVGRAAGRIVSQSATSITVVPPDASRRRRASTSP